MLHTNTRPSRNGFTLIELLVVIGIVGVLTALLLVGLQYGREASRRLSCANNLKQLGLALSGYETSHRVYPQGVNGGISSFSAQVVLLPFLEQGPLFNAINSNAGLVLGGFASGQCNETVGRTVVAGFLCPSDPDASARAATSYAWNGGLGKQLSKFVGGFCAGATGDFRMIGAADVKDGLSNTAAASEWRIGRPTSGDDSTVVFRVKAGISEPYDKFIQKCRLATRQTTDFGDWKKKAAWPMGGYSFSLLNFNTPPNSLNCYYDSTIFDLGNWPAGSYHSGGVNVLFFDAHTSFYRSTTSAATWRSISTRAAGDFGD